MAKQVNLGDLTPEQKEQLFNEFQAKQKEKADLQKTERAAYKKEVDGSVNVLFEELQTASQYLGKVKNTVLSTLKGFIEKKSELYGKDADQTSHSFTNEDGSISIIIGYNMTDGWDDTVNSGISKVNGCIRSFAKDKESKALVDTILKLLSKDGKGNLKASRVLQLKQIADKTENKELIDGIAIIHDAYRPVRSKEYVRCEYKAENGEKKTLPLSITDAEFIEAELQPQMLVADGDE